MAYLTDSEEAVTCLCLGLQVVALYLNHSVLEQARSARREGQKWQVKDRGLFPGICHVHDRSLVYSHAFYCMFLLCSCCTILYMLEVLFT